MSDASDKAKAPPKPADRPVAKPAAPPDGSPRFKTLDEVEKALIRLRQSEIELDEALITQMNDFFVEGPKPSEPELSLHWLDQAEALLKRFVDTVEGIRDEHTEHLADLNPALVATELTKTEGQVRVELNALKGTRFAGEKAVWRDRIKRNLDALRDKQARQAEKLLHEVVRTPEGRLIVRPTDAWWEAYTAWLVQVHEILRAHIRALLEERWPRFIQEHVQPVMKPLDAELRVELPTVPLDQLPNPFAIAKRTPAAHYRDADDHVSLDANQDVTRPQEVILTHEIDRAVMTAPQGGVFGILKSFGGTVLAPLVVLIPGVPMAAKGLISVSIAIPAAIVGVKRQRKLRTVIEAERVSKSTEALKQKLVGDFAKRLARHSMDLEVFVLGYNAEVQKRVFSYLSDAIDRELERRKGMIPEEKTLLQRRKQQLQRRVKVFEEQVLKPLGGVLVDLELRRKELRREVQRRASGEG